MTINWVNIHKKYKGQWVALKQDESTVVGHGKTAKEALEKANKSGALEPILTKIPKSLHAYVGCFL